MCMMSPFSCSERTEVCTGEVCKNGGTCEADGSIRHTCYCVDGYTGLNCEENIGMLLVGQESFYLAVKFYSLIV